MSHMGTFIENALAKARHAAAASGLPALADDSGICVDALGGAPRRLLGAGLRAIPNPMSVTTGGYSSCLPTATIEPHVTIASSSLLRHVDDPQPLIAEGEWHGEVLRAPRGTGGFGYDPLFPGPHNWTDGRRVADGEKEPHQPSWQGAYAPR
jgi:XTP/dITP diphosphohydrolase